MARSSRLRVSEVRAAVRLAWECVELGHDPDAWPAHLADGLTRMTGAVSLLFVEHRWGGPRGVMPVRTSGYGGPLEEQAARFAEYTRTPGLPDHVALARFLALPTPVAVRTGRQLQPDREWATDPYRHQLLRQVGLDDGVLAKAPTGADTAVGVGLIREWGRPRFGRRERRLVELVHSEIAPRLGTRLATAADPVGRLTPRQRQVLECLLDGDGEKQAAVRLGVSVGTVHEHVKRLHQLFAVSTRAELLAYFLRRSRGG